MHVTRLALIVLAIMILGLSIVDDYGLSADEMREVKMVRWNYERITKGTPLPGSSGYYGTVFNFAAEAAYRVRV